jgi:hypothetical protein
MRRRFVFRFAFLLGAFLVAVVAVNVLVFHGVVGGNEGGSCRSAWCSCWSWPA